MSIVLFIVLVLVLLYFQKDSTKVKVKSDDGDSYFVLDKPDAVLAANKLASLKRKLISFIKEMDTVELNESARRRIERLKRRFNKKILENAPGGKHTSYTVSKGKKIHMCIRQTDDSFVSDDIIFHVALHELAHIMSKTYNHTPEFKENFYYLKRKAGELGYYSDIKADGKPKPYCGTIID